ncbi:alpha/beta fold hydrolase [Alsobacter sp. R-9]
MVLTLVVLAAAMAAGVQGLVWHIESKHPPLGRRVPVDGGQLHVMEAGPTDTDAPTILLIHGASGNAAEMMLALGEPLGRRLRVLAVDRPGHGWSDRPGGREDAAPERQARLIRQAAEAAGAKRVVVVAHSLAGVVGTRLALDHADFVEGLVLVSPVTHPWPGGIAWYYTVAALPVVGTVFTQTLAPLAGWLLLDSGVRGSFAPQSPVGGYAEKAGIPLVLRPSQFRANAQDVAALLGHVEAQYREYDRIRVPTVAVHGEKDTVTSHVLHSEAIARQVPGAGLVLLPDVGHMPHHVETDVVVGAVDDVLQRGAGAQAGLR